MSSSPNRDQVLSLKLYQDLPEKLLAERKVKRESIDYEPSIEDYKPSIEGYKPSIDQENGGIFQKSDKPKVLKRSNFYNDNRTNQKTVVDNVRNRNIDKQKVVDQLNFYKGTNQETGVGKVRDEDIDKQKLSNTNKYNALYTAFVTEPYKIILPPYSDMPSSTDYTMKAWALPHLYPKDESFVATNELYDHYLETFMEINTTLLTDREFSKALPKILMLAGIIPAKARQGQKRGFMGLAINTDIKVRYYRRLTINSFFN